MGGVQLEKINLLKPGNVEKLIELTRPDIICHFAWTLGEKGYRNSEENLKWVEISLRLLSVFKGRRFIYSGSSSQYGIPENNGMINYTLYGRAKQLVENAALAFCINNKISFASARYFTIYGPGDMKENAAIPNAIQTLLRGDKFICYSPYNLWDFIYVKDAAQATIKLIENDIEGIIDIGSGKGILMRDAFNIIGKELNGRDLIYYDYDQKYPIKMIANTERMKIELNYTCKTTLEEGIKNTIEWWKNQKL